MCKCRNIFLILALALITCGISAPPSFAQFTQVSATVTDPNGIPYGGATVSVTLVPAGGNPTLNGVPFSAQLTATADTNGTFNLQLADNNIVLPGGTQWRFSICQTPGVAPPFGFGSTCFTSTQTITGASQSLSVALTAAAPALVRSLPVSGNISVTSITTPQAGTNPVQIGSFWYPGTATGLASAPSTQPGFSVVLAGGAIADGTYYFKTTNWTVGGETTGSPTRTVTVAGGGGAAIINIGNADSFYMTGAPGYRIYASNNNVNFFRQTPNPVVADFMVDAFTHYNSMGSLGARLTSLTFAGTALPVANTAVIDKLQVALNATRRAPTGTSPPVPFGTLVVAAIDGTVNPAGQFIQSTPLVSMKGDHIVGSGLQAGFVNQQSRILDDGTWNNAKLGTVMVFGGDASISNVGIQGSGANGLMYLGGVGYQGGNSGPMVVENVSLRAPAPPITGIQVAAFKRAGAVAWVNGSSTGGMLAIPPAAGINSATTGAMNLTAGNWVGCTVRWGGNGAQTVTSVSNTAGDTWSSLAQFSFGTERIRLYYAENSLGNAADQFTANFSAPNFFVVILCDQISGIAAAASLDVSVTGQGLGSTVTSGLFTTTNANDLIYAALESATSQSFWTPGTGYTIGQSGAAISGAALGSQFKSVAGIQTNVTASASHAANLNFSPYVGVGIQYDVYLNNVSMSGGVYLAELRNAAGGEIYFTNGRWDASGEGFVRNVPGWTDPDNGVNDACGTGGFCNAVGKLQVKGVRTESGHGLLWDVRNTNFTLDTIEVADQQVRAGTDSVLRTGCTVESGGAGGGQLTFINTGPGATGAARVGTFVFSDGTCNGQIINLVGSGNTGVGSSTGVSIGLDANNVGLYFTGLGNNAAGANLTFNPTLGSTASVRAINLTDNSKINYFCGGRNITGEDDWCELAGRLVIVPFTGTNNIFSRAARMSFRNDTATLGLYDSDDVTKLFDVARTSGNATLKGSFKPKTAGNALGDGTFPWAGTFTTVTSTAYTTGSIGGGALLAGACATGTVTVTGVASSDALAVTPVTYPGAGIWWDAYISAANQVTVVVCAAVASTPTASTYNVRVIK